MLKVGQIVKVGGEAVRIISADSDLACLVWACAVADPDRSVWFYPSEIEA